jgi:hypothetical protein
MMSKKEFEAVAEILRINSRLISYSEDFNNGAYYAGRSIARELSQLFKQDNPRFDAEKFLSACGIDRE